MKCCRNFVCPHLMNMVKMADWFGCVHMTVDQYQLVLMCGTVVACLVGHKNLKYSLVDVQTTLNMDLRL